MRLTDMPRFVEGEHSIGLFEELVCRGVGTVHLVSGPNPHLVVIGPEERVNRVVVRYRGMRLVVAFRVGPNPMAVIQEGGDQLRVVITTDAVAKVVAQGFASVRLGESEIRPLTSESLRIVNSGSGRITGDVSCDHVDVRLRGVGGVSLGGDASKLNARLSGVGSFESGDLVARRARVAVNGMGSARVMVLDELVGSVSGAGSLSYRGSGLLVARGQAERIHYLE